MTSLDYFFASLASLNTATLLNATVVNFDVPPEIFERFSVGF